MVRLQFDPSASGKTVIVSPAQGVAIDPADGILHVQATGECFMTVALDAGLSQSHLTFDCQGLATTLPLARATAERVTTNENQSAGNEQ